MATAPRPSPSPQSCRAAVQLGRTVNRALDGAELTPAAYRFLGYLASGSSAATAIADNLAVSRPTVTATTTWLVERGLVTRTPDPRDGRQVTIGITDRGSEALVEADRLIADRLVDVLSSLDDRTATSVLTSLDVLFEALTDYRTRKHRRTPDPGAPA